MRKLPTRYDAVMICYHDGIGPSATREVGRRACTTKLGADFARRFRLRPMPTLSMLAGNYSMVTEPGDDTSVDLPEWYEKVWRPFYWVRSRWDGIRYGLDRDRRS